MCRWYCTTTHVRQSECAALPQEQSAATRAFEHFVDAHARSDEQIAAMINTRAIDVLVDLMGWCVICHAHSLSACPFVGDADGASGCAN
jgi:cytochrome c5